MLLRLGLLRKALMGGAHPRVSNEHAASGIEAPGDTQHLARLCQVFVYAYSAMLEEPTIAD